MQVKTLKLQCPRAAMLDSNISMSSHRYEVRETEGLHGSAGEGGGERPTHNVLITDGHGGKGKRTKP